jgi:hypothetical protein
VNIIQAIEDKNLFRPFLDARGDLSSWQRWLTALRVLHGLPLGPADAEIIRACTGRDPAKLPSGFRTALFLIGRRSGKSRIAALIAAFEAALSGRERLLSPGEIGLVAVISPTRFQSRIVRTYIRAVFDQTPILKGEIVDEGKEGFTLKNGVEVQTLVGDYRTVRGFSLLCAVVDEVCFFGLAEENKVKSDTELVTALRPGLATTQGSLIAIGSPYTQKGWAYATTKRCFGNDASKTLVWRAPSRTMNPTLPQSVIDEAMAEDPAAARAEYLNEWRTDIAAFVPRELVENLVVPGRMELPPMPGFQYAAFADLSGGRSDDAALAIAHKEGRAVVLDKLERFKSPHNPYEVVARMTHTLRTFGLSKAVGDAYAAEWVRTAFESHGIRYERCTSTAWKEGMPYGWKPIAKPKAILYAELLPRLTSGEIELLDNDLLVTQLSSLERRTRSGGRDVIDHPPGGHDDLANVIAGVCDAVSQKVVTAGSFEDDAYVLPGDARSSKFGLPAPGHTAFDYAQREFQSEQQEYDEEMRMLSRPNSDQEQFAEWMRQNTDRYL